MSRILVAVLALAAPVAPADAQTPPPQPAPAQPGRVEFLPRFAFHFSMAHLVNEDARFDWDANFGGDLDLVDYGAGRLAFVANYQTILGNEFKAFDPNQGNYILEGSLSARAPAVEIAGVFHHVSRHLSDRPKRDPIDWNMIGGRVRGGLTNGRTELQMRADIRGVVQKTFVDYRWEAEADIGARVSLRPRVAVVASGSVRVLGVNASRGRDTQQGFRGEGGVRMKGRGAALELFVAAERVIDPYQLEFSTATWLTAGFRLSSVP